MSIYDSLNEKQREGVETVDGPVLLLAGAGSGKTRVLTYRISYLIEEEGVNPWNILAITFTNKAAKEMRERVDKIVEYGADQIWVATFHSTCVRILRRHIERLGYDNHFTIYDTDDQKTVMKDICKRLQVDTKKLKERSLLGIISSAKNELMDATQYELENYTEFGKKKICEVYKEYEAVLKSNNALDFDDLIMKTVELFRTCPDVLMNYQNRFRYIMVDEYQDTNTAQFELIHLLAKSHHNLCVVGDDDQSIYKFRGANIRNILDFEKVFPEAATIKLEQNYRSTANVLAAANAVISNNKGRKGKNLWTESEDGAAIRFRQFETAYEEADFIADNIRMKCRDEGLTYKDCAILYRTNAQSRLLEERMIMLGIPYTIIGGINFYARKEIKDILAYLKTIDNARDDVAVKRIINIPKRGIGQTTIQRVQDFANEQGISFFQALVRCEEIESIGKASAKLLSFVSMIHAFRGKLEYFGIKRLVEDVLESTKYIEDLEASNEEDAADRVENIDEFINKVVSYEETAEQVNLSEFLAEVALVAEIDKLDEDSDKVLLMTLHGAKGLEFPHVYLAGMEDGVFPSYMCITSDDASDLEEERRLAYVGITRAEKHLTITCAKFRMIHGETQCNMVSRFVKEIPEDLLDSKLPAKRMREQEVVDHGAQAVAQRPVQDYRPKAVLKPKVTPEYQKPFFTQTIKDLNQVTGITKGMPSEKTELGYQEGDRVSHIKFGEGTVVEITDQKRDYRVQVDFDGAGSKIMFASFAKLKKC